MADHSSKLHLVVDVCGIPIYVQLTGEQVHDSKVVNILIKSTTKKQTQTVVAGRGYDSSDIRACDFKQCAESVIPVKSNFKSNNDTLD